MSPPVLGHRFLTRSQQRNERQNKQANNDHGNAGRMHWPGSYTRKFTLDARQVGEGHHEANVVEIDQVQAFFLYFPEGPRIGDDHEIGQGTSRYFEGDELDVVQEHVGCQ